MCKFKDLFSVCKCYFLWCNLHILSLRFFLFFLFNFSKQKLFVNELVMKWAIIVARWVKISGTPEDGSVSSTQNRYVLQFLLLEHVVCYSSHVLNTFTSNDIFCNSLLGIICCLGWFLLGP